MVEIDLSHCWSCERTGRACGALAVLTSPRGPYALCPACGPDLAPRDPPDPEYQRSVAEVCAWLDARPELTRTSHVVEVESWLSGQSSVEIVCRYRWRCACGDTGDWHAGPMAARSARDGGGKHVAAMERR